MHLPGLLDYHDKNLLSKDGTLEYLYPFFTPEESETFFKVLHAQVNWVQDKMEIYDKVHPLPRLICWYSENDQWLPELLVIKEKNRRIYRPYFQYGFVKSLSQRKRSCVLAL